MEKRLSSARPVRSTNGLGARSRESLPRRILKLFVSPYFLALLTATLVVVLGSATYYYYRYTALIDAGLRGDVFVRTSGIYAAPPELRTGQAFSATRLAAHLRRIGYVEGSSLQNSKRGQYVVRGATVELVPGSDAGSDGPMALRPLKVTYARGGESITAISDLKSSEQLDHALVEPELISSVINQDREKRKIIDFRDLPQNLLDAIIAIEDRQFFEHSGINWRGIARALVRDYQTGEWTEGGSSITQQLVKNFFLKPDKSLKRKLSEAYISILLEQRLTKEQIMTMYCNQVYLGQRGGFSINGFGQAARSYFDKDVSNLTLSECALLAGILRSPNYYSPFSREERAVERRNLVLEKMVEAGKVDRKRGDAAKALPLGVKGRAPALDVSDAPYFIDYLMRQLEEHFNDQVTPLKSLRIYSTLDLDLQRAAYQAVTSHMASVEKMLAKRKGGTAGLQAALVAMNPKTGEIVAMVGGRNYAKSQLNRATDARRQPGSVFKPFVYATALSQGTDDLSGVITPATMMTDAPRTFEYSFGDTYSPENFGKTYAMKPITVRDALVNSKNVITVELAERVGFRQVARLAERAGIEKVPTYPSMALGVAEATPLQVAAAYTIFANQGRRTTPFALKRIMLRTGTTLFESSSQSREVVSPQVAYLMTSMMQDVIDRGTGAKVRQMGFKGIAAGKTGSSRDGWFAGYTPNLVCVVWVGFDDNADLGLTGAAAAAPIWAEFMKSALAVRPELGGDFTDPGEITTADIDPETGQLAQAGLENVRHELFIRGTEPVAATPEAKETEPPSTVPSVEPAPPAAAPEPKPVSPSLVATKSVTLDVCSTTGLLAVTGVCPKIVSRSYALGLEPRVTCSRTFHDTRPRLATSNPANLHK
jgi:penicillin-binding protein 1B